MVRTVLSLFLVLLVAGQSAAQDEQRRSINGEDLREMLRKSEQDHRKRDRDLKYDQMHQLYSIRHLTGGDPPAESRATGEMEGVEVETDMQTGPAPAPDDDDTGQSREGEGIGPDEADRVGPDRRQVDPPGNPSPSSQTRGRETPVEDLKGRAGHERPDTQSPMGQQDRYIPPSWSVMQGGGDFDTDQVKRQGPYFGIRMGTRIHGELRRVVTNVERNLCEIHVSQDVIGDRRIMPQETVLFCSKSLNQGTKRLEMASVKGITPDGTEFTMTAYVMDTAEMAGLSGAITADEKTAQRSLSKGVYEVGRQMVSTLNNGSVVGAGVEAAADNALDEKETETGLVLGQPNYIITVAPQKVVLRVEKTF